MLRPALRNSICGSISWISQRSCAVIACFRHATVVSKSCTDRTTVWNDGRLAAASVTVFASMAASGSAVGGDRVHYTCRIDERSTGVDRDCDAERFCDLLA